MPRSEQDKVWEGRGPWSGLRGVRVLKPSGQREGQTCVGAGSMGRGTVGPQVRDLVPLGKRPLTPNSRQSDFSPWVYLFLLPYGEHRG